MQQRHPSRQRRDGRRGGCVCRLAKEALRRDGSSLLLGPVVVRSVDYSCVCGVGGERWLLRWWIGDPQVLAHLQPECRLEEEAGLFHGARATDCPSVVEHQIHYCPLLLVLSTLQRPAAILGPSPSRILW